MPHGHRRAEIVVARRAARSLQATRAGGSRGGEHRTGRAGPTRAFVGSRSRAVSGAVLQFVEDVSRTRVRTDSIAVVRRTHDHVLVVERHRRAKVIARPGFGFRIRLRQSAIGRKTRHDRPLAADKIKNEGPALFRVTSGIAIGRWPIPERGADHDPVDLHLSSNPIDRVRARLGGRRDRRSELLAGVRREIIRSPQRRPPWRDG